jgi:hypothetical protein
LAQCFALGRHLRGWRCGNAAGTAWFCNKHKRWPIIIVGGLAGTIALGLLTNYIWIYISTPSPPLYTETKTLQAVHDTQSGVSNVQDRLERIEKPLENNPNENSPAIKEFVKDEKLESKYPLGFALFYSDGRRTLHYDRPNLGVNFDPAGVKVQLTDTSVCVSSAPITVGGIDFIITSNCFGRRASYQITLLNTGNALVKAETVANSTDSVAWVMGIMPAVSRSGGQHPSGK